MLPKKQFCKIEVFTANSQIMVILVLTFYFLFVVTGVLFSVCVYLITSKQLGVYMQGSSKLTDKHFSPYEMFQKPASQLHGFIGYIIP
jgi:hypothetical protein